MAKAVSDLLSGVLWSIIPRRASSYIGKVGVKKTERGKQSITSRTIGRKKSKTQRRNSKHRTVHVKVKNRANVNESTKLTIKYGSGSFLSDLAQKFSG